MSALIPINIVIGDRTYRVKISASDEEEVRRSVKLINDKLLEFKTQFAGKDMQDYIAMVLLWFATKGGSRQNFAETELEELTKIETLLDERLK